MTAKVFYIGSSPINMQVPSIIKFYHCPTIQIQFKQPQQSTEEIPFTEDMFVVFFSKNAVQGAWQWLGKSKYIHNQTVWTVGKSTAKQFWQCFQKSSIQPKLANAQGMIECFEKISSKPVLLFVGNKSKREFRDWLQQNQWQHHVLEVYETDIATNQNLSTHFTNSQNEYLLFSSPSSVEGFLLSIQKDDLQEINAKILSIGPTTSQKITSLQGKVFEEAPYPDLTAFVTKLLQKISQEKTHE